ncbi:MAG: cation-translocating P-type ATPase [Isosphaeraceae bacterium]
MKIHQLSVADALRSLHARPEGLTSVEAQHRLHDFGPNQVERVRGEPLWLQFLKEFTHFFAVILWVAAALAFCADWNEPGQGMGMLGGAIVGVIVINSIFSFVQVYRAEKALSALEKLLPHQVRVLRNGVFEQRPAAELVPGDVIALEAGDIAPADCRLIEAFSVRVNNATVTGESVPLVREAGPCGCEDELHSTNVVLAGTTVVSGNARAVVFATGMLTEFGKIAHLTQATREIAFPLQREIAFVSRVVAVLSVVLGGVFFVIGRVIGVPFWTNFVFAIGIISANVPEGLLPEVTLSLAIAAQRMARRNVLIRHLPAVETLGSVTVICTDKTGTLTENRMHAEAAVLGGERHNLATSECIGELGRRFPRFFEGARLCQSLKAVEINGKSEFLGDPTEIALVELSQKVPGLAESCRFPRRDELPFDSERMRFSTLHETPEGLILYTKGAIETVLPLCTHVQLDTGVEPVTQEWRDRFLQAQGTMADGGLRVLALAYRPVAEGYDHAELERDLTLTGLVGLDDPPRPEVPDAIARCRAAGIRVIMITGDHPQTARAVARQIGLVLSDQPTIVTGDQLHLMSNIQLQLALNHEEVIFARVAADQKRRIVSALKRKRQIVAVTGDGVNDAPALKRADIGIAMGVTGTDVAREAADMVLTDDNFASIVAAVEEGRAVFDNIRKFLTYVLTSNVPELVPYLIFFLFKVPPALTVIQILGVDLGTNMLPALALGAEKPASDVMSRPPRSRDERLLQWWLLFRVYFCLGLMESLAAMSAFFFVLFTAGWHYGQVLGRLDPLYLEATTACFAGVVLTQVVNVFLCRSDRASTFAFGLFENPLILWGVGVELLLLLTVVYTPWGRAIFGTASIPGRVWLFIVPFMVAMLAVEEVRKWVVRSFLT